MPKPSEPQEGPTPWLEFFRRIRRLAARLDAQPPQEGGEGQG